MSEKITPHHLTRKAILYVRQSSAYQVTHNLESQRLQYAMQERLHLWSAIIQFARRSEPAAHSIALLDRPPRRDGYDTGACCPVGLLSPAPSTVC